MIDLALIDLDKEYQIMAEETAWAEAERKFAPPILFMDKFGILKGMDDGVKFLDSVIDELATCLAGWIMDNKDRLALIQQEPEAWKRKFLVDAMLVMSGEKFSTLNERITELKQMKNLISDNKMRTNWENREVLIKKIKKIPIESLVVLKKSRTTSSRTMGCCPLHEDNRPSFTIFRKDNTWRCFAGCGGGDIIDLCMAINKCSFNEAISALGGRT